MKESSQEKQESENELLVELKKAKKEEEEINNFSIGGKIVFNDFKINLYSKFIINKDKETNMLNSSSLLHFSHQVTPWMKYSLKEHKKSLKFCTSISPFTNFLLTTKIDLDNTEKVSSAPTDIIAKYNLRKDLSMQIGIKDFNLIKEKIPNSIYGGLSIPFNLWGNNKFCAKVFSNYCLKEKFFKSTDLNFDISNTFLNAGFNLSFNKKNKSNGYKKKSKFNGEVMFNDKLSMGTELNFNKSEPKETKLLLFTKYIIDPFTDFYGKWEDKDKSITFKMNHDFRGLLKFGITGKFTPVQRDKKDGFFKFPHFSTRTGISMDIC